MSSETTTPFRDAEAFLADLGVERAPIVVRVDEEQQDRPAVSVAEAERLVAELPPPDDDVSRALSTIRASTAAAPASEGRIARKLLDKGIDPDVVELALAHARAQGLVDDPALAAALVAEWRAQGHGPAKLRAALRKREFDEVIVDQAVAVAEEDDPMAVAFELAVERAERLSDLPPETAYRRVAAFVARRGHPEAIARKAARDAVYDRLEDDRVSGH